MAKYLLQVSYTAEGAKGLLKEGGTSRRSAIEDLVKQNGGTVEAFYFAFGEDDVVLIVESPDAKTVTALSLTVGASGAASVRTTVLLTPEEVDDATQLSIAYRAPGA
jgi:uncharacterized protein with GYD domain